MKLPGRGEAMSAGSCESIVLLVTFPAIETIIVARQKVGQGLANYTSQGQNFPDNLPSLIFTMNIPESNPSYPSVIILFAGHQGQVPQLTHLNWSKTMIHKSFNTKDIYLCNGAKLRTSTILEDNAQDMA